MSKMTMNEYQIAAQRTSNNSDSEEKIINGAMGLAGEAGEVIDIVKKYLFQGHGLDREAIKDELGDVLWYIAETGTGVGVTLEEIAKHNIKKLKKRFPKGFEVDRSVNREED